MCTSCFPSRPATHSQLNLFYRVLQHFAQTQLSPHLTHSTFPYNHFSSWHQIPLCFTITHRALQLVRIDSWLCIPFVITHLQGCATALSSPPAAPEDCTSVFSLSFCSHSEFSTSSPSLYTSVAAYLNMFSKLMYQARDTR